METLFLKLVNLSLSAGWLVLAALVLRLVFRKAPRWIFCLLWGLVALRLACPFSVESALSLLPSAQVVPTETVGITAPVVHTGIPAVNAAVNPVLAETLAPAAGSGVSPARAAAILLSRLWLAGVILMALYALGSWLLLRRRLCTATRLRDNIRQSEAVETPFVLGLFRPVIYLPYRVAEGDLPYVIAHEQAHIRRRDHWWKPLGFALLAVYWFQPLLWLAYWLLCRDIEGACDEKVIREMDTEGRRGYAAALLRWSVRPGHIAACPLAFGEVGVKKRVKAVIGYRKPAFWIIAGALIACAVAAVCFLTDPVTGPSSPAEKRYTYEGKGFGGDFTITVRDDGTFNYYEGPLSSYLGNGTWAVSGDILTLTDLTGAEPVRVNRFRMEGDDLVFLAEGSDNFLYVQLSDGEMFYGEALPDAPSGVTKWLDYTEDPSRMDWDGEETMELPEFPGVTFHYTPERITAREDGEEFLLITGMPIWNVYFKDFTGDGLPELCATLSWGSGAIDTRVVIYDYANGASYTLEDRMVSDYALRYEEADGLLYVDQRDYSSGELLASGTLVYADGCIQAAGLSPEEETVLPPAEHITTLPGEYDFDGDGTMETTALASHTGEVPWYELLVKRADGTVLWQAEAYAVHSGYGTYFACRLDGRDYLLQYAPTMYQGFATYSYRLFSLDSRGEPVTEREGSVSFDLNWGRADHQPFEAEKMADFLEEVNGLLSGGRLLMNTDPNLADLEAESPRIIPWWLRDPDFCGGYVYDDSLTLRENLRAMAALAE